MAEVTDIAPNAMGPDDVPGIKPERWTMIIWGREGVGKTHFAFTMPEPVCVIDTEGKADELASKFNKEFHIWQPENYYDVKEQLPEAIAVLDHYREEEDKIGTLVVDSMSILWNWAQEAYVEDYYPNQDPDDVDLDSALGGGQSDWQKIKHMHNSVLRQTMLNTPYHLGWTAMAEKDYNTLLERSDEIDKAPEAPSGEKNNKYKVSSIVHIYEDLSGTPIGELDKSGLAKHRFTGMEWPTFPQVRDAILEIAEAEASTEDVAVGEIENNHGIQITEGNPRMERILNE